MRRRDFMTLLCGAAAWPLAAPAHAQQRDIATIGFMSAGSPDDSGPVLAALRQGLKDAGLLEGHKVRIEFRWAQDQPERLPALASDLVAQNVALIFAVTNAAAVAAKSATTTIPIVFAIGGDPVSLGLVSSIDAPGGNATGVTARTPGMYSKRLDLLRQLEPKARTIGILLHSADPTSEIQSREAVEAVGKLGLELRSMSASNESDLETAFHALAEPKVDALIIPNDAFFNCSILFGPSGLFLKLLPMPPISTGAILQSRNNVLAARCYWTKCIAQARYVTIGKVKRRNFLDRIGPVFGPNLPGHDPVLRFAKSMWVFRVAKQGST